MLPEYNGHAFIVITEGVWLGSDSIVPAAALLLALLNLRILFPDGYFVNESVIQFVSWSGYLTVLLRLKKLRSVQ
jgi:hypothetical protein